MNIKNSQRRDPKIWENVCILQWLKAKRLEKKKNSSNEEDLDKRKSAFFSLSCVVECCFVKYNKEDKNIHHPILTENKRRRKKTENKKIAKMVRMNRNKRKKAHRKFRLSVWKAKKEILEMNEELIFCSFNLISPTFQMKLFFFIFSYTL